MKWIWKKFGDLTVHELYGAIQLREKIFIIEQACIYLDCDGSDPKAWHLLGYRGDEVVAYTRTFPAGIKYPESSFGRVVTAASERGAGTGKLLMNETIYRMGEQFGLGPIRISAQAYLEKFYSGFGFVNVGEPYLEDDIPHIEMLRV